MHKDIQVRGLETLLGDFPLHVDQECAYGCFSRHSVYVLCITALFMVQEEKDNNVTDVICISKFVDTKLLELINCLIVTVTSYHTHRTVDSSW